MQEVYQCFINGQFHTVKTTEGPLGVYCRLTGKDPRTVAATLKTWERWEFGVDYVELARHVPLALARELRG